MRLKKGDRYCTAFHIQEALTLYLHTMNLINNDQSVVSVTPDTDARVYKFKVEKN